MGAQKKKKKKCGATSIFQIRVVYRIYHLVNTCADILNFLYPATRTVS